MSSLSRQQLESWLKTIDVKADSVLDIGGSQLPINKRVRSWEVNQYKILDIAVPHELKQAPDIIADLEEPLNNEIKKDLFLFDVAFCIEVSEYWFNPLMALLNINKLLKPGGILYISTHFVYPVHNPAGADFLRYTKAGIVKLLEKSNFAIDKVIARREKSPGNYLAYCSDNRMRPNRETDHSEIGHLIKAIKI